MQNNIKQKNDMRANVRAKQSISTSKKKTLVSPEVELPMPVCWPLNDKLAFEIEYPEDLDGALQRFENAFEFRKKLGLAKLLTSSNRDMSFSYEFAIRKNCPKVIMHITVNKSGKSNLFMRVEFNPNKAGSKGLYSLRLFLQKIFRHELSGLIDLCSITKFHPAINIDVPMRELLIFPSRISTSKVYFKEMSKRTGAETFYIGSYESDINMTIYSLEAAAIDMFCHQTVFKVVNDYRSKHKSKIELVNGDLPADVRKKLYELMGVYVKSNYKSEHFGTRFEIRFDDIDVPIGMIDTLTNYFKTIVVYKFSDAEEIARLRDDEKWIMFLELCRAFGFSQATSGLQEATRKRFDRALKSLKNQWDPDSLWKSAMQELKDIFEFLKK